MDSMQHEEELSCPLYDARIEGEPMDHDDELLRDAEVIEQQLRFIRRALQRAFDADKRKVSLTFPQLHAMELLTRSLPTEGVTLKELSEHMGLAHSTVSGIVDRLERQGLVRRLTDASDRRYTRIAVTDAVKAYMQQDEPVRRLSPLVTALQHANEAERKTVLEGLAILRRLLMSMDELENK